MSSLEFLSIAAAEQLIADWPDVYFSPGYGKAAEYMEGGEWELAVGDGGRIIYPYIKRAIEPELGLKGRWDLVSPYGYAGVWAQPGTSLQCWSSFRQDFRAAAKERGFVSEFLRLGGLVPGRSELLLADPNIDAFRFNDTIALHVSEGYDHYWRHMEGRSRTAIRKAQRIGYSSTIRPATEADLSPQASFPKLYNETMMRLNAAALYRLPVQYFEQLRSYLGEHLLICEVRDPSGHVGSAALFMRHGSTLHYHLAGSAQQAARDGANNLLINTAVTWAIENNVHRLHLGGGVRDNDGLFRFKIGFGGSRLEYWLGRSVLNQGDYDLLCKARAKQLGCESEVLAASGFFPKYRAQL